MITEYDPLELMAQVTAQSFNFQDKQCKIHLGCSGEISQHNSTIYIVLLVIKKPIQYTSKARKSLILFVPTDVITLFSMFGPQFL